MLSAVTVRAPAPKDPRDAILESRKARAAMAGHLVDRRVLDKPPGRRLSAAITRAPGVKLVLVNGKYVERRR